MRTFSGSACPTKRLPVVGNMRGKTYRKEAHLKVIVAFSSSLLYVLSSETEVLSSRIFHDFFTIFSRFFPQNHKKAGFIGFYQIYSF